MTYGYERVPAEPPSEVAVSHGLASSPPRGEAKEVRRHKGKGGNAGGQVGRVGGAAQYGCRLLRPTQGRDGMRANCKGAAQIMAAATKKTASNRMKIAVVPGDGIGNEVVPEGIRVLEAVGRRF